MILWQLIQDFAECIDPSADLDAFFDFVWNVDTAEGIGLDVWGRIVGASRTVMVQRDQKYFDFAEATVVGGATGFDQAPFYDGETLLDPYSLDDGAFRQMILAKALANICDGSIKALNQVLMLLFPGRGNAYVTDNADMSMVYTFTFTLTPAELAIIYSDVLPRPAGVYAYPTEP